MISLSSFGYLFSARLVGRAPLSETLSETLSATAWFDKVSDKVSDKG